MNQRQFASVLFAALGVLVGVSELPPLLILVSQVVTASGRGLDSPTGSSPLPMVIMALVGSLAVIGIGAALVMRSDRLAARLFPQPSQPLAVPEAHAVALSVLGCYFAVEGLSHISRRFGFPTPALQFDVARVAQLVLGLMLFFGARGLSGLWGRLRATTTYAPPGDRAV